MTTLADQIARRMSQLHVPPEAFSKRAWYRFLDGESIILVSDKDWKDNPPYVAEITSQCPAFSAMTAAIVELAKI